jgi:TRAP transporter TAXI family solute receptor
MMMRIIAAAVALLAAASLASTVHAADAPLVFTTDQAGSAINACASIIASLISRKSPIQIRVRAYAGPEAWFPEIDSGHAQLGLHFSSSIWMAYNHVDTQLHTTEIRTLRSSLGTQMLGFMVRQDSPLRTVTDLKGKRVTADFGGQPALRRMSTGGLAAYGLTYDDVLPVPVVNVVDGVEAVVDGRADASWGLTSMPVVRQGHQKVGLRFIAFDATPERLQAFRAKAFPGAVWATVVEDNAWAPKGRTMVTQEVALFASRHLSDGVVASLLNVLWDNEQALIKANPALRGFENRYAVSEIPAAPYHRAAVAFYKSKGVWTAAADAAQRDLGH